jgi:hypothetical protein
MRLPPELLKLLKDRGMTLQGLMQDVPEWAYMGEIDMMLRSLPDKVHEPINVKDTSAFTSFFAGAGRDVFTKWLVLFDLNEKICNMTETGDRFPAEHYVAPVAAVLMQQGSPLFVINKSLDILTGMHNAGESALRHMCKIAAFPEFLVTLVERLCDDEDARNAVGGSCGLMADACMELLCNVVIKCCAERTLQARHFLLSCVLFCFAK